MGLDSVELIIGVEDAFGIEFPDLQAERIATVGDCYEAVRQNLALKGELPIDYMQGCDSQRVFYQLRAALAATNGPPLHLTPETLLEDVFPDKPGRKRWRQLKVELPLLFPSLGYFRPQPLPARNYRELVALVLRINFREYPLNKEWYPSIFERLRSVIVEKIGVRPAEVCYGASFTHDLGVD